VEDRGLNKKKGEAKMEIVETWSLRYRHFNWMEFANCVGQTELFFVESRGYSGAQYSKAKEICHTCPVKSECLKFALENSMEFGVWGGKTPAERDRILARRRK
jgi:WhiB family redox-sensing transcriptional regulator